LSTRDALREKLERDLSNYEVATKQLPGIRAPASRQVLIEQLVDSVRRVQYVRTVRQRDIAQDRSDPYSEHFDPVLGALHFAKMGEHDEACWLIFLSVHCGRHLKEAWGLARELYAGDKHGSEWTWARVSANPGTFRKWLDRKNVEWSKQGNRPKFGNHRKYVSLSGSSGRGTGEAIETYVDWVLEDGSHAEKFGRVSRECGDPRMSFEVLYRSLAAVQQFGRLARFDFLCMLGKCELADIEPGHAYLTDATGPRTGAQRLFQATHTSLEQEAVALGAALGVGMQVIEDALCNWVKTPGKYTRFRG